MTGKWIPSHCTGRHHTQRKKSHDSHGLNSNENIPI
jgi:hypothetical protein